jgi:hypothetical protein
MYFCYVALFGWVRAKQVLFTSTVYASLCVIPGIARLEICVLVAKENDGFSVRSAGPNTLPKVLLQIPSISGLSLVPPIVLSQRLHVNFVCALACH